MEKGQYLMRIGMISVLLNVILNWTLSGKFGAEGIAL